MMIKESKLTRGKKLLGAVIICALTISGLMMWYTRPVAEAAVIDPHPGLVGWWRFDEIVDVVKIKDSSGNGNDGTVYGATLVDGKYGKALSFDGISSYLKVDNSAILQTTGDLTIEAWVYVNSLPNIVNSIIEKHWNGEFSVAISSGGSLIFAHGAPNEDYTVASGITTGQWYHLVVTRNMSSMTLTGYIDGVGQTPVSFSTSPISSSNQDVYIGREDGTYWPFAGIVDEVRIYNRALRQDEIQAIFQKKPDFSANLLAKIPKGTTQVFVTLSWQGIGNINVTIDRSPSESYTEDMLPIYQKTVYSSDSGDMLNIKRLTVAVTSLSSDESWYIELESDQVEDYKMAVEIQK